MDKFVIQQSVKTSNKYEKTIKVVISQVKNPNFIKIYPWIEKHEDENGVITVFCSWCKVAKKVNQFMTDIQSLQKQTFERHLATNDY
ncbi:15297_t:CDS:2 [Racocetra persica]|uniref:15297_t:CDS:1 n=1 Tax=Racocetra persica TaxID=160502 RepID=A0ACA9LQT2_9GLOM|nr:15297_t:CDS:2 [Racocetra persica]